MSDKKEVEPSPGASSEVQILETSATENDGPVRPKRSRKTFKTEVELLGTPPLVTTLRSRRSPRENKQSKSTTVPEIALDLIKKEEEPKIEIKPCKVLIDRKQVEDYAAKLGKTTAQLFEETSDSDESNVVENLPRTSFLRRAKSAKIIEEERLLKKAAAAAILVPTTPPKETKSPEKLPEEKTNLLQCPYCHTPALTLRSLVIHKRFCTVKPVTSSSSSNSNHSKNAGKVFKKKKKKQKSAHKIPKPLPLPKVSDDLEEAEQQEVESETAQNEMLEVKLEPTGYEDTLIEMQEASCQTDEWVSSTPTIFQCVPCKYSYSSSTLLKQHVLDQHFESVATTLTTLGSALKQGIKMVKFVSGIDCYFQCPICKTLRHQLIEAIEHLKLRHPHSMGQTVVFKKMPVKVMKRVPLDTLDQQMYLCGYCDTNHISFFLLKRHMLKAHKIQECMHCICFFLLNSEKMRYCPRCLIADRSKPLFRPEHVAFSKQHISDLKKDLNIANNNAKGTNETFQLTKSLKAISPPVEAEPSVNPIIASVFSLPAEEIATSFADKTTSGSEDCGPGEFVLMDEEEPMDTSMASNKESTPSIEKQNVEMSSDVEPEPSASTKSAAVEEQGSSDDEDDYGLEALENLLQKLKPAANTTAVEPSTSDKWKITITSVSEEAKSASDKDAPSTSPLPKPTTTAIKKVPIRSRPGPASKMKGKVFGLSAMEESKAEAMAKTLLLDPKRFCHIDEKKYIPCLYCPKVSKSYESILHHLLLKHSFCPVCRDTFMDFEAHLSSHEQMRFFQCSSSDCKQTFRAVEHCVTHEEFVHDHESLGIEESDRRHPFYVNPTSDLFHCFYCAEYFADETMSDQHLVYEHNVCRCPECLNYFRNGSKCVACELS